MSQRWILAGEQFGSLMRIAATVQRFIVHADEKLTAFVDLEAAIRYKYQNELFRPGRRIAKS
jgi:hypothetical protein